MKFTIGLVAYIAATMITPAMAQSIPQNTRFHGGIFLTFVTQRIVNLQNQCSAAALGNVVQNQQSTYGIQTADFNTNQFGIILSTGSAIASEIIFNPPSYTHATAYSITNASTGYASQVALHTLFP